MTESHISIVEKIRALDPVISELLAISGSPCLSIGVIHHGEVIFTNHRGQRDISQPDPPNDQTIYRLASLTKTFTVAAIALLVEEGHLHWNDRIREILPEFKLRKDIVGREATLIDILSNRTGLSRADSLFGIKNGESLLPRGETMRMSCVVQAVKPFREGFCYSGWNFDIAGRVIEKVTGKTYGAFIKEKIFDPLNMRRTTTGEPDDDNMAMAHGIRKDGTACKITFPGMGDDGSISAVGGGKSTLHDLLLMFESLLAAYRHQKESGLTSTPGSPFTQLQTILAPHLQLTKAKGGQQDYCLGFYRTVLPGYIGLASPNNPFIGSGNRYVSGKSREGLEVFQQPCNAPGTVGSVILIPSSETAIYVTTNSIPLSDPTDFASRLILSIILGEPTPTNFVELSKLVRRNYLAAYERMVVRLEKGKTAIPPHHPLEEYEGDYFNSLGNYFLRIEARQGGLLMIVQGLKMSRFSLLPYDGDTFYWPADWDQALDGLASMIHYAVYEPWHKIVFTANANGEVDSLTWDLDSESKPETFTKRVGGNKIDAAKL
ncbi:hypothetical protein NHQ30_003124 [Ciborinia camelliae]|nr:hypothetical protein NHQ30_003124 [Ciborinia camelliae]